MDAQRQLESELRRKKILLRQLDQLQRECNAIRAELAWYKKQFDTEDTDEIFKPNPHGDYRFREYMGNFGDTEVNKFRTQAEQFNDDGFGYLMPITLLRLTWDEQGGPREYWTSSENEAHRKKFEIDHSGNQSYRNCEGWFAYREDEHDRRFGFLGLNCKVWWR